MADVDRRGAKMDRRSDPQSPDAFLASLDEPRRSELAEVDAMIRKAAPRLRRYVENGMLGYGRYHYRYASGREGESCIVGLASRKAGISVYVNAGDGESYLAETFASRLGKVSAGRSCVRIKRLDDVDRKAFTELIRTAARTMKDMPGVTVLA